jgi:adenine C2-methylase RlmN of 23S rRNA A2503 and tRNA A37
MIKEVKNKTFSNGIVYALETEDGYPIETTDTFLPFYTKDAIGEKQNLLTSYDLGSRAERWMIGVSCMSGCPVRCLFCATGTLKKWRSLTAEEIVEQVKFAIEKAGRNPSESKEFKINYTRMGEPFLNIQEVKKAISIIDSIYPNTHHYISTIGVKDADYSWIKDNVTLQVSLHSLDDKRRNELIPYKRKVTIADLGKIRTKSKLKTTVNMTLVDEMDFDVEKLQSNFSPDSFFVKVSPINVNCISDNNKIGSGIIKAKNLI